MKINLFINYLKQKTLTNYIISLRINMDDKLD